MDLENLIGTKSRITVLRKLCVEKNRDFTISELAKESCVDKSLVSRIISELEKSNVVSIKERGNLKLCQINHENGAYKLLDEIFASEKKITRGKFRW